MAQRRGQAGPVGPVGPANLAGLTAQPGGVSPLAPGRPLSPATQATLQPSFLRRGMTQASPAFQTTGSLPYGLLREEPGLVGTIPSTSASRPTASHSFQGLQSVQSFQNLQSVQSVQSVQSMQGLQLQQSLQSTHSLQSTQSTQTLKSQSSLQLPAFELEREATLPLQLLSPTQSTGDLVSLPPVSSIQSEVSGEVNPITRSDGDGMNIVSYYC